MLTISKLKQIIKEEIKIYRLAESWERPTPEREENLSPKALKIKASDIKGHINTLASNLEYYEEWRDNNAKPKNTLEAETIKKYIALYNDQLRIFKHKLEVILKRLKQIESTKHNDLASHFKDQPQDDGDFSKFDAKGEIFT